MSGRADRLRPVVVALRAAEQGRLAACLARIRQGREEAAKLRSAARAAGPGEDGAGMLALGAWQRLQERRARAAIAAADALESEASSLRRRLALALGREKAVDALAAADRAAAALLAARRADDAAPRRPVQSSGSELSNPPGSSSVGTA